MSYYATEIYNNAPAEDKLDRKSTRLNSSHVAISYAVFCLKKKKHQKTRLTATWKRCRTTYCCNSKSSIFTTPNSTRSSISAVLSTRQSYKPRAQRYKSTIC